MHVSFLSQSAAEVLGSGGVGASGLLSMMGGLEVDHVLVADGFEGDAGTYGLREMTVEHLSGLLLLLKVEGLLG